MKRCLLALLALISCGAATLPPVSGPSVSGPSVSGPPIPSWSPAQITVLRHWVAAAPEDALPVLPTSELDRATAGTDKPAIDRAATALALSEARMHLLGARRSEGHIVDSDARLDLPVLLAQALAGPEGGLDHFFAGLRPQHPDYAVLRAAYATEKDPARRATLALNMERWRWLPQSLGHDYVLVNIAAFEVSLWRQDHRVAIWPIVVGKVKTPTPVFAASITGVIFNPWWDVPANIAPEIARLVRRHPALMRQRGYVRMAGRYRQRPGPANSLGQMKLVMPNPFDVYLHDTPEKKLFAQDSRAFSHGCMRVSDALGFATTLLQGAKTPDEVTAIVATGKTTTVPLAAPLPVYVTYFTATTREDGTLVVLPDIYARDAAFGVK